MLSPTYIFELLSISRFIYAGVEKRDERVILRKIGS